MDISTILSVEIFIPVASRSKNAMGDFRFRFILLFQRIGCKYRAFTLKIIILPDGNKVSRFR